MSNIHSVKRDIIIQAPLEKVWQALTQPEHLNRWYTKEATVDFRVGGRMKLAHGWGVHTSAVITEITELKQFVMQSEDMSLIITTLEQEADGVRVTIEYQLELPSGDKGQAILEDMAYGTYQFLQNLKSVYETGEDQRSGMWRTWIGITHTTTNMGDEQGTKVLSVSDQSPAKRAGLLPGDIISEVNGRPVRGYYDLEAMIHKYTVNDELILSVWRNGQSFQLQCGVAAYPHAYSA